MLLVLYNAYFYSSCFYRKERKRRKKLLLQRSLRLWPLNSRIYLWLIKSWNCRRINLLTVMTLTPLTNLTSLTKQLIPLLIRAQQRLKALRSQVLLKVSLKAARTAVQLLDRLESWPTLLLLLQRCQINTLRKARRVWPQEHKLLSIRTRIQA